MRVLLGLKLNDDGELDTQLFTESRSQLQAETHYREDC